MADIQNAIKCLSNCCKVLEQNKKLIEASQKTNSVAIIKAFKAGVDNARQNMERPFDVLGRQMAKAMLRASRGPNAMVFSALFKGATEYLTEDVFLEVRALHNLTIAGLNEMKLTCDRLGINQDDMPIIKTVHRCSEIYLKDDSLDFISYVIKLQQVCVSRALVEGSDLQNIKAEDIIDADSYCFCLFWHAASEFSKQLTLEELNIDVSATNISSNVIERTYIYKVSFKILRKNGLTIELLQRSLVDIGRITTLAAKDLTFELEIFTNTPQHIISYALKFGEITDVEIINLKDR